MVDIYVGSEKTHWILHEQLLCYRSKFFQKIFSNDDTSSSENKSFELPDEEEEPFQHFVGWLYSGSVRIPEEEKDLGVLLELYLMGEKWQIAALVRDVLETVRRFYKITNTYPSLRRVQYMYANTDVHSPIRQMMVACIARMMCVADSIPQHWDKALRKNGQLSVDIIQTIQDWKIDPSAMPDARDSPNAKETEKVKGVEEAEKQQEGKPKELNKKEPQDDKTKQIKQEPQEEGQQQQQQQQMTNGVGEEQKQKQ